MSNIQKQHKISPAIAWLTIQKFIIFYCPLDGEHTTPVKSLAGSFCLKGEQNERNPHSEKSRDDQRGQNHRNEVRHERDRRRAFRNC